MEYCFLEKKNILADLVADLDGVCAIGQSGALNEIPNPGESDIDLFVLCETIPTSGQRNKAYQSNAVSREYELNVCEGGHWGIGDEIIVDGIEVYLMYFTVEETWAYLSSVMSGDYPDSDKGFYPVGRLATYKNINILYDEKNILNDIKNMLAEYPKELAAKLISYHIDMIIDEEDFERVLLRKDILFYHQVFENSLDHFLQVLYALNKTYFPSRKRSEKFIEDFRYKPEDCYGRIIRVIKLGSDKDKVEESVSEWYRLVGELKVLCNMK